MIREDILISLNSRGKVQVVLMQLEKLPSAYTIHRFTGQYEGKQTHQPEITITAGKAKRTVLQQAELEYNSKLKSYLDKGYKELISFTNTILDDLDEATLRSFLGDNKEDSNGIPKPMLAVQSEKVAASIYEKTWFISRKLDGIRGCLYLKDGTIKTASRGGGEYDIPTSKITSISKLQEWFKLNPTLMLDGELYCHGVPLQRLSGMARVKTWEDKCDTLEYWIYDVYSEKPFRERLEMLDDLRDFLGEQTKIKVIDHYEVSGYNTIKKWHDKFVSEGYEGLIMRCPDKEYGIGKRSAKYMVKVKNYQESEFKIVGYSEGLRDEDMVFVLETPEGKTFEAKPYGPRELKYEYLENMDRIIGKMATIKYFCMSEEGVPMQTNLKVIRDYE